jgi:hypothetical protein
MLYKVTNHINNCLHQKFATIIIPITGKDDIYMALALGRTKKSRGSPQLSLATGTINLSGVEDVEASTSSYNALHLSGMLLERGRGLR